MARLGAEHRVVHQRVEPCFDSEIMRVGLRSGLVQRPDHAQGLPDRIHACESEQAEGADFQQLRCGQE